MSLSAWILATITWLSPPDAAAARPAFPGWTETAAERRTRYERIAADMDAVIAKRTIFGGPRSKGHTAALVLAIASHESGFAPDVDIGPCYPLRLNGVQRCDGGRAVGLLQVWADEKVPTPEGWTKADLWADRQKVFAVGIRRASASLKRCAENKPEHRLADYASGSCKRGLDRAAEVWAIYRKIIGRGVPSND